MAAHIATGECEVSCLRCVNSPQQREVWGCDREAPQPFFEIECPRCNGAGSTSDCEECSLCHAACVVPITRCPNVTIPKEIREAARLAIISEDGPWPEPGGTLDQSAWFLSARAQVLGVITEWRAMKAEAQK